MGEFSGLEGDVEKEAKDHPQDADKGLQEAGQFADKETGGKYDKEVQTGVSDAEKEFGGQGQ